MALEGMVFCMTNTVYRSQERALLALEGIAYVTL